MNSVIYNIPRSRSCSSSPIIIPYLFIYILDEAGVYKIFSFSLKSISIVGYVYTFPRIYIVDNNKARARRLRVCGCATETHAHGVCVLRACVLRARVHTTSNDTSIDRPYVPIYAHASVDFGSRLVCACVCGSVHMCACVCVS